MSPFRLVPHTADVGLRISGKTWEEFYLSGALGLLSLCGAGGVPAKGKGCKRSITLRAATPEELLVDWLNELNYLLSAKRLLPVSIGFEKAGPSEVDARLGVKRGARLEREVKSASYHHLKVRRERGALRATVILDV